MRNMSFMLTIDAFRAGIKTVTRRCGWKTLKPGEHFMAVEKCQGLKKGERMVQLGECVCVANDLVRLDTISSEDVIREGFPGMTPQQFVQMFCEHMKVRPDAMVRRIEFKRVK